MLYRGKADDLKSDEIRLYDPIDHHWTVEGNKFTGKILADYVLNNYLMTN